MHLSSQTDVFEQDLRIYGLRLSIRTMVQKVNFLPTAKPFQTNLNNQGFPNKLQSNGSKNQNFGALHLSLIVSG
jgi:hypothetical protein